MMIDRLYRICLLILIVSICCSCIAYAQPCVQYLLPSVKRLGPGSDPTQEPADDPLAYYRQLSSRLETTVKSLLSSDDYWSAELTDLKVNPNAEDMDNNSIIVLVYLKWDAMNGPDRAKTVLQMFSDDIAFTISKQYTDDKIASLWCFWEMPYLLDKGYIAKYEYEGRTDGIYRINAMGALYGWD